MRFLLILIILAALAGGYYFFVHERDEPVTQSPTDTAPTEAPEALPPTLPDVGETPRQIDPLPGAETTTDGFVPPVFQPIEAVVGNWNAIPPSAFPRDVTLAAPASFQLGAGSSSVPAGAKVVAVGHQGNRLIVAPSANSNLRGEMSMDDTDFKQILTGEYDAWKERMTLRARQQWEYAQSAPQRELRGQEAIAAAAAAGVSGPPAATGSASSDLVNQSLARNPLRELLPQYITRIGEPALVDVEGEKYWAIAVDFTAQTRFGPFPTQAQALIRNDRIERWIYTGSGEPVP